MKKKMLLDSICYPQDIRKLSVNELPRLCDELRNFLIDSVSNSGGHFASNLGTVELTVALHYVFDTPNDKLVWDVGHQAYIHKILTGRKDKIHTIRQVDGLAAFPKREESEYDLYNTGHAGTSISQALGEAISRDHLGKNHKCIAVIGDASISSGLALEAINHAGYLKTNLLVVLNDNYMSISKNTGSMSEYLNHIISLNFYNQWKKYVYMFLKWLPIIGPSLDIFFRKVEKTFKNFLIPGGLFEDFGFRYIGPTDGHNVKKLVKLLQKVKNLEGPILLHTITQKGKGYDLAEKDPIKYHGVSTFKKKDGIVSKSSDDNPKISYSQIVGKTLIKLTEKNSNVVAITPAMIEGSGLKEYSKVYPNNIYDVGMAEQHALTFSGALSSSGLISYMCIYSTFMTRALDQLTQDVSLMNFPLKLIIDRAGCVGGDGETHQGFSDISYLLTLPQFFILAPSSGQDIIDSMKFMQTFNAPISIRIIKDSCFLKDLDFESQDSKKINDKKLRVLSKGDDITIISVGFTLSLAKDVVQILHKSNIKSTLIDLFWINPLDIKSLEYSILNSKKFVVIEESYPFSGVSPFLLSSISSNLLNRYLKSYTFPKENIFHGERNEVLKKYNLTSDAISKDILKNFKG